MNAPETLRITPEMTAHITRYYAEMLRAEYERRIEIRDGSSGAEWDLWDAYAAGLLKAAELLEATT